MTVPVRLPDLDDELAVPYWEGFQENEVRLPRCTDCGEFHWYPKRRCPYCTSNIIRWEAIEGRGTLFTWVGVEYDFKLHFLEDSVPYYSGLVTPTVDESIRLAVLVSLPEGNTPEIGMELQATFPEGPVDLRAPVYSPR